MARHLPDDGGFDKLRAESEEAGSARRLPAAPPTCRNQTKDLVTKVELQVLKPA